MTNALKLAALGDPTRRAIFEHLAESPSSVGALAERLPVSRPAVSQHLKVLKDAGLVTDDRDGTRHIYRLEPNGVADLRDYLDRFWSTALVSFKARVEKDGGSSRDRISKDLGRDFDCGGSAD
jgi:DNA-binding transcriptional ArsR family regulator